MRRVVLLVLIFLLPLQWSWAAAASVCAHESDAQAHHLGHHEHQHHEAQPSQDDDKGDAKSLGYHADCGVCHASGTPFLAQADHVPGPCPGTSAFAPYQAAVGDRALDTLLRPPLTLVG